MAILRKLPAAVAVAALTATLVGCGSGNVKDERDQALADLAAAEEARMAAVARGDAAEEARAAAEAAAAAAMAAQMAAEADAAAAMAAQMAAEAESAAAMEAQMAAEAAAAAAEAARMVAEAESAAAKAAQAVAEAEAAEEQAARMAAEAEAAEEETARMAAETAAEEAMAAQMAAETAAEEAMAAQMAAETAAEEAKAAQMAAEADAAEAAKARMAADDALMKSQEELAATKMALMEAEAEVARLEKAEADRLAGSQTRAERRMVATSRALYQTLDEKMQLVMQAPVVGATAQVDGEIMATTKSISWVMDAGAVTSLDAAGRADDTVVALRSSGTDPTMMGEWTGNMYDREVTRLARATTDTAMVYTNKALPKNSGKPFAEVHGTLLDTATRTSIADTILDGTSPPTGYTADGIRMLIGSPEFATSSGTKNHANNTGGGVGVAHTSFEARGTFDGAPGTYRCVPATTCTSAVQGGTGGTEILLNGGAWTFTPDVGAMTDTETADSIYFAYGWWLRNSDELGYQVGTFTDYVGTLTALDITLLEGKATYMGHAAGRYSLLPGLDNPTGDVGHFTANVELTAEWGDEAGLGTLSGTVDGFMGADGMARDWTVELLEAPLTAAGMQNVDDPNTGDVVEVTETVWTIGTGPDTTADKAGMWTAQLYEAQDSPHDRVPLTVLGEFTAEHGVVGEADSAFGHIAGAFGATHSP